MPDPENDNPYATGDSGSGEGTWTKPERGKDGKWYSYNSKSGEYKEVEAPPTDASHLAPLFEDLQNLGLLPLTDDPNYYISNPDVSPNATRFVDQYGNIVDQQAQPVTEAERKRLVGQFGDGGDNGAASRAERGLQEQIRQNRINEAMNAIQLQTMRQKASLAGAQFAAPMDTGGYFPQMGPDSPIVRSGLADPMKFTPTPYNANIGDEQIAKDLAMIRSRAGVG
ncbi:MAG: hypothetical protein NUW01_19245 [Gemmatimonadaceae bacterium]|nr:hypothetical protein [Gemmatimonadaceae bacterium]